MEKILITEVLKNVKFSCTDMEFNFILYICIVNQCLIQKPNT